MKIGGKTGNVTVKLDMNKTYNRVDQKYIYRVMIKIGFERVR